MRHAPSPSFPSATLAALTLFAAAAPAQALRVPSQYLTITSALSVATGGMTVLVAPGVYHERLVWPGHDGIRLIGEGGPEATILDGGAGGTVVMFGQGLTNATVLEGFTIRNGRLQSATNRGAGVQIVDGAPTLRHNRITGNVIDAAFWNHGAGVYVGGTAAPLLLGNEIDGNEARGGAFSFGGGVHIAAGASVRLVGNHIHHNLASAPTGSTTGRGHGAGVFVAGTALLASNRIVANTTGATGSNLGAGVHVAAGGNATLRNNTIADNRAHGPSAGGGGVFADGAANATLRGDIVAGNSPDGVHRLAGAGIFDADHEVFWANGTDRQGVAPGPNDLTVNPGFVGGGDVHLSPTSPCIDALPAAHAVVDVPVDGDGDPRQLDGDLSGNARTDHGADEFTSARLGSLFPPVIGSAVVWMATETGPAAWLLAVAFDEGAAFFDPFGHLLLGATAQLVGVTPVGSGQVLMVPADPQLRGVTVLAQALVLPLGSAAGRLTNRVAVTIR
jgi:hypothetical protein